MKERLLRLLSATGYAAFFVVAFLLFFVLTFPWSRVRDRVMIAASRGDVALVMDSLRPGWVGATAREVRVGPIGGGAPWIELKRGSVRTGLFGALRAGLSARAGKAAPLDLAAALGTLALDLDLYGGSLDIHSDGDADRTHILLTGKGIDLGPMAWKVRGMDLDPAAGLVGVDGDLNWVWKKAHDSLGDLSMTLSGLAFDSAPFVGAAVCSTGELHVHVEGGKADFRDTALQCDIGEAQLSGYLTLHEDVMRSRLVLRAQLKPREDIDNILKALAGGRPRHRDDEGWYHWQGSGTLRNMRWRESVSPGKATPTRPDRARPSLSAGDDDDDDDTPKVRRTGTGRTDARDRVERDTMSDEDRAAAEERREQQRAQREELREARRKRREELLARRKERQEAIARGEEPPSDARGEPWVDPVEDADRELMDRERKIAEELQRSDDEDGVEDPPEEPLFEPAPQDEEPPPEEE